MMTCYYYLMTTRYYGIPVTHSIYSDWLHLFDRVILIVTDPIW